MATRPLYSTEAAVKFHVQNIKLPQSVTWESLISSASDEVDAALGLRYVTPIALNSMDPVERPAAFWLQNVTALIAAGRLLLSIAAPGSQNQENQYGSYLITNAQAILKDATSGKTDLVGVPEVGSGDDRVNVGPTIINGDTYSQVDAFYGNFMGDGIVEGMLPPPEGSTWP